MLKRVHEARDVVLGGKRRPSRHGAEEPDGEIRVGIGALQIEPGVGDLDRSRAEDAGALAQARERRGIGVLGEAGTVPEANGLPRCDLNPPAAERKVERTHAHVGPCRNRIAAEVHFKGLPRERDV